MLLLATLRVQFPKDLDKSVKRLQSFAKYGMPPANSCAIEQLLQEILELRSFLDRFLFISGSSTVNGGGKGDTWVGLLTVRGRWWSCEGPRSRGVCFGETEWSEVWGYRDIPAKLYLQHERHS